MDESKQAVLVAHIGAKWQFLNRWTVLSKIMIFNENISQSVQTGLRAGLFLFCLPFSSRKYLIPKVNWYSDTKTA